MILHGFTDGASRGNPGESGIGIVIRTEGGDNLVAEASYIGKTTNNAAEYEALLALLDRAQQLSCSRLIVHSDSELMVRQLSGSYKIKSPNLKEYYRRAKEKLASMPFPVEIRHVLREENSEADRLANIGIDRHVRTA
ncbi:MAG TPA: ribonuclease HI family protein [Bacteroidota bacterium]|nr:ribonuclease HI family protein [Bacteroidota bacterium]